MDMGLDGETMTYLDTNTITDAFVSCFVLLAFFFLCFFLLSNVLISLFPSSNFLFTNYEGHIRAALYEEREAICSTMF